MIAERQGVFPALMTELHRDGSLDLESTARQFEAVIEGLTQIGEECERVEGIIPHGPRNTARSLSDHVTIGP